MAGAVRAPVQVAGTASTCHIIYLRNALVPSGGTVTLCAAVMFTLGGIVLWALWFLYWMGGKDDSSDD
jgi:hypothetical protein